MSEALIGYTPAKKSNAVAGGLALSNHRSGQTFFDPASLTDFTDPTRLQIFCRELNLLFERIWMHLMPLRAEWVSGLQIAVGAGQYRKADASDVAFAGGTITVADATSGVKVWLDHATNALVSGTSWPVDKTAFTPICECDTASGAVTDQTLKDRTQLVRLAANATSSSPTGTTASTFTIDNDAVAAGDRTLLFQLGAALWAGLKWVNASTRFDLLADISGTLAKLNTLGLAVSGTDVISSSGKLAAGAIDTSALYTLGANGATPAGLRLTPAAGTGAPSSGTHAIGEQHCDSAGTCYLCIGAGTPGTWIMIGKQDGRCVLDIGGGSGTASGALSFSVQVRDGAGQALSRATVIDLYLQTDADGTADDGNVTAFSATVGSVVKTILANKIYRVKTNASGLATLSVTRSTAGSVYVLAAPPPGSPLLDCSDNGILTWS